MKKLVMKIFFRKDVAFNPGSMELPGPGAVTVEAALHKMSTQTGVIVWDTICGCMISFLLLCMIFVGGNVPLILLICVILAAFLAAGHIVFRFLWKKHSYTKAMLSNTAKYLPLEQPSEYAAAVNDSLGHAVLSYEKEFILTQEYILGSTEWNISYTPVAIPREQIAELAFYYKDMNSSRYSYPVGILCCRLTGRKPVELALGPFPKADKVLKILDYYHIEWREGKPAYL